MILSKLIGDKRLPFRRYLSLDTHSLVSFLREPPRPALWRATSHATVLCAAVMTNLFLKALSSVSVHNLDSLLGCLDRDKDVPLITVSNHISTVDDPCVWSTLPLKYLVRKEIRWNLVAQELCYKRVWCSYFFLLVQSIPVIRGQGVYQEGMDFAIERLCGGGWVHVFAEGKINDKMADMRFKWGVGRLVYETPRTPIVLPMHIIGLQDLLPPRWPYIPRPFKNVTINFGNQIDLKELVCQLKADGASPEIARKAITDAIQEEALKLKKQTEQLHPTAHSVKYKGK